MQRHISNSGRGLAGILAGRGRAILALTALLLLSACGSSESVRDNNLPDPPLDGVPPALTIVTMQPDGVVKAGQSVKINFTASEALMTPVVFINNVRAEVSGAILDWNAVRQITDTDPQGVVVFTITYQDASGERGQAVTATTDGSSACLGDACPREDDLGELEGNWKLDFAGVGPSEQDTESYFKISDTGPDGPRACWFDDIYQFGRDGSFRNVQGDETWIETWQGAAAEGCGAPVAPHDGSNNAVFEYDDVAKSLKLTGLGAYLGLAKVVNGKELKAPSEAPGSVTYKVVELIGDSLKVKINVGGAWWEFRLSRVSNLPIVGKWKLNFAGVGPSEQDTESYFKISDTGPDGPRACWFDDIYYFGDDGKFQNFQDGETWIEAWQGAAAEGCGAPVAPHDGSNAGAWYYDEGAGTVRLDGVGSFLGLAKVVNGKELKAPSEAPAFITYKVVEVVGDNMTVKINVGGAWWEYNLVRD